MNKPPICHKAGKLPTGASPVGSFPYPKERPASAKEAGIPAKKQHLPVTLIGDGYLYRENLQAAGKDEQWVRKFLSQQNAALKDVWLLTVDAAGKTVFLRKEGL